MWEGQALDLVSELLKLTVCWRISRVIAEAGGAVGTLSSPEAQQASWKEYPTKENKDEAGLAMRHGNGNSRIPAKGRAVEALVERGVLQRGWTAVVGRQNVGLVVSDKPEGSWAALDPEGFG